MSDVLVTLLATNPQAPTPQERLQVLLDLLNLERVEDDIFRGRNLDLGDWKRLYGGQVAAQALVAASRTVPSDRPVHSLHSYFIRPGDPTVPVVFLVDRIRDGRSFTTRRVVAVQNGQAIFSLSASFQFPAPGLEHGMAMPAVPGPDQTDPELTDATSLVTREFVQRLFGAIDAHNAVDPAYADAELDPELALVQDVPVHTWLRTIAQLPDDQVLHAAIAVFASDFGVLQAAFARHRIRERGLRLNVASLDHAMWFHHAFRADEWLLYTRTSPSASGSRALGLAHMFTEAGQHVVTVMQEAMARPMPPA